MKYQPLFITATDTEVGKTVSTLVLATLLRKKGLSVGVLKPVQCAGDDAKFLKKHLNLDDDLSVINPFFAKQPLSPHLALRRDKIRFSLEKVKASLKALQDKYDIVLIEGAGGLMVPITPNYLVLDLIKDLQAKAVVISRLGLGTINHTTLTVKQMQDHGIDVQGVIFNDVRGGTKTVPEKTNPVEINKLLSVPVLGTVPHLKSFTTKNIESKCAKVNIKTIIIINQK